MNSLSTLKEEARAELHGGFGWNNIFGKNSEAENEIMKFVDSIIDRTYHATKEEVRGIIEKHEFQMDIKEYLQLVKAWKGGYDVPFDDGYSHAKKDILAALEDTTTSPAVS